MRELHPSSARRGRPSAACDRRTFFGLCAGLLLWPLFAKAEEGSAPRTPAKPTKPGASGLPVEALETSGFVYVSPLRADGSESTCHGEVWFAWLDGAVVLNTTRTTWKARALARGLDRARIWVGDHGRWKGVLGRNEAFRQAPHFDARVESVRDDALFERLIAAYAHKYPKEFGDWGDRMREGYREGSRLLLRYTPIGSGRSART